MSADAYVLVIPAPCDWLNVNHRQHWAPKAELTKAWRGAGAWAALAARLPHFTERVHIVATVHQDTARKYDPANFYTTAKAVVDGLQDAGVLIDDDAEHVIGPDMRRGEKRNPSALTITIRRAGENAA